MASTQPEPEPVREAEGGGASVGVRHTPERRRYEVVIDDAPVGFTAYREPDAEHRDFIHTEIEDGHEGQGLAGRLVRFAMDDVRGAGLRIIPHCPYVAAWLKRHPGYEDITDWP